MKITQAVLYDIFWGGDFDSFDYVGPLQGVSVCVLTQSVGEADLYLSYRKICGQTKTPPTTDVYYVIIIIYYAIKQPRHTT